MRRLWFTGWITALLPYSAAVPLNRKGWGVIAITMATVLALQLFGAWVSH